MKETFVEKRFNPATARLLEAVIAILDDYASQGYDLSLRQLYYQFIAKDLFPESWIDTAYNLKNGLPPDTKNTEKNYKNLGGIVSDGRLAGLIDWDAIKDRGRATVTNSHWSNPADILKSCVHSFRIDKWDTQPCYVEMMVEKQALEGVLEPVCRELDIAFTANKGYSSSSALYETGKRYEDKISDGKECHIIYMGDHDPSGIDMTRDVDDRIAMFANADPGAITVHRIALNLDQVRKLNPPENPAKITDSRAASYIARFGESSWELDAIEPRALAKLVRDKVAEIRDDDRWERAVAKEAAMKAEIAALAKKSKFK